MIPYGRQDIDETDIDAVVRVLRSDWLTTGPAVEHFERDLQAWTGGVPVVAVSSGTAALHAAYAGAGLGPGDEIVTTPLTFVATQAVAVQLGVTPVFVDVESDTGNLDPRAAESAITSRTRAIVTVDYAGHPANMVELRRVAERFGLILIEDAAHSLGSSMGGRPTGSLADITTFSFFPTKNITTGEGGAVAATDPDTLRRVRRFSRQGLIRERELFVMSHEGPWHQEVHAFGLNYRLPDILAALGSSQLVRLEAFKAARAKIKARYDANFAGNEGILVPVQHPDVDPVWHLYPLRVPVSERRRIFEGLRRLGINVQVNYLPAYRHPAMAESLDRRIECPNAEDFYAREISLPIWNGLDLETVDLISDRVLELLGGTGSRSRSF